MDSGDKCGLEEDDDWLGGVALLSFLVMTLMTGELNLCE